MIDLENRIILTDGTVICRDQALFEMLYSGREINGLFCENPRDEQEWSAAARVCDSLDAGPTHADGERYPNIDWFQHWLTPEPWSTLDVRQWCIGRCKSPAEVDRASIELDEFEKRDMMPVIRHVIYCVDTWRRHGVVWGVGRGSSVCSFVLHLIGINRINPLEHGLEFDEWLK